LRRKVKKRKPAMRWLPLAAGAAAVLILGTVGLILAFNGKKPDSNGGSGKPEGGSGPVVGSGAGKRVLFVVPSQGLHYRDYAPVKDRLKSAGVVVDTAATRSEDCVLAPPMPGKIVTPNKLVKDVVVADYDAILFCGQNVTEYIGGAKAASYTDANRLVRNATRRDKVLGAICAGQAVLGHFGALKNVRVAASELLRPKYGEFEGVILDWDKKVLTDGRIVTAAGPDDAIPFADAVLAAIPK